MVMGKYYTCSIYFQLLWDMLLKFDGTKGMLKLSITYKQYRHDQSVHINLPFYTYYDTVKNNALVCPRLLTDKTKCH